jgi:hypothetical protein
MLAKAQADGQAARKLNQIAGQLWTGEVDEVILP